MACSPIALVSVKKHDAEMISFVSSGECSKNQREIGIKTAREVNADVVVGVGGGKVIDLAKAIAFNVNARMVSLPTIASNDAPTSSCSVYYTDEGVLDGYDIWPRNPDMVLIDTRIIADAPIRWLISGIGDALATWFEAEGLQRASSCFCRRHPNYDRHDGGPLML